MKSIDDKILYFAELLNDISKKMTFSQKKKVKSLLEEILNDLNYYEIRNKQLTAKLSNKNLDEYDNSLEKTIAILDCLGFDPVSISQIEKPEIDFIMNNYESIIRDKPMTIDRFNKFTRLIRLFRYEKNRPPQTLKELNEKFRELQQQD